MRGYKKYPHNKQRRPTERGFELARDEQQNNEVKHRETPESTEIKQLIGPDKMENVDRKE